MQNIYEGSKFNTSVVVSPIPIVGKQIPSTSAEMNMFYHTPVFGYPNQSSLHHEPSMHPIQHAATMSAQTWGDQAQLNPADSYLLDAQHQEPTTYGYDLNWNELDMYQMPPENNTIWSDHGNPMQPQQYPEHVRAAAKVEEPPTPVLPQHQQPPMIHSPPLNPAFLQNARLQNLSPSLTNFLNTCTIKVATVPQQYVPGVQGMVPNNTSFCQSNMIDCYGNPHPTATQADDPMQSQKAIEDAIEEDEESNGASGDSAVQAKLKTEPLAASSQVPQQNFTWANFAKAQRRWQMMRLLIPRSTLEKWTKDPMFNSLVKGFFVCVSMGCNDGVPVNRIARIVDAKDSEETGTKEFVLSIGNFNRSFGISTISNRQPTHEEISIWEEETTELLQHELATASSSPGASGIPPNSMMMASFQEQVQEKLEVLKLLDLKYSL